MERRLIEHFVNSNLLSRQDMQRLILRASKAKSGLIVQILESGVMDDEALAEQIAAFYQLQPLDSGAFFMDDTALGLIDRETAEQIGVLPYGYEPGSARVFVAVYDPDRSKEALAQIEQRSGQPPVVRVAPKGWLERAIALYYGQQDASEPPRPVLMRNELRSQTSWTQRPRSSGRVTGPSESDFGADAPMLSGMHRISSRVGQSPRAAAPRQTLSSSRPADSPRSSGDFDEFEALLRDDGPDLSPRASVIGRPRLSRRNEDSGFAQVNGQSTSSWERDPQPGPRPRDRQESGNFSLFDSPDPDRREPQLTLQEIAERHHQQIKNLKSEAQRQREVIQALADLLIEARVISRRDLTQKLQALRQK